MMDEFCPNCSGELLPYYPYGYDKEEGYCPNIECDFASVYDGVFEQARKNYIYNENYNARNWGFDFKGQTKYWNQNTKQDQINKIEFTPNKINEIKPISNIKLEEIRKPLKYKIELDMVVGHDPIKRRLRTNINHKGKKKIHTLIAGAPATAKTVFLKTLEDELIPQGCDFHYLDSSTLSPTGLIDYLFDNDVEVLGLDELDKIKTEYQAVFLNMLETGTLQVTKKGNTRKKDVKAMTVVATANYLQKIIEPVIQRFMTLYVPRYTREQFLYIGSQMLPKKYPYITQYVAEYITKESWNKINPPTLRTVDRLGNMIRENPTVSEVDQAIKDILAYEIPQGVRDKLYTQV